MLKHDVELDHSMLYCVNPYEVNPVATRLVLPTSAKLNKEPQALGIQKSLGAITGGDFVRSKVKLEMEKFSDLESLLGASPIMEGTSFIDELNTPVVAEKGPFDFRAQRVDLSLQDNTVISRDPFQYDNLSDNQHTYANDIAVNSTYNYYLETEDDDFVKKEQTEFILPSVTDKETTFIPSNLSSETPTYYQDNEQSIEENSVSVISNEQLSRISSPNESCATTPCYVILETQTPEESNSYQGPEKIGRDHLKFNFTEALAKLPSTSQIPDTPDVIESIFSLEDDKFNIFDYMNEQEPSLAEPSDDELPNEDVSHIVEPIATPQKRKRRRKNYDDDDEDYVPPKKLSIRHNVKVLEIDSGSSTNDSPPVTPKQRGRPRRTSSFSSDCSGASKYRELRDKNNEASRKSRQKRKLKEKELEKEADELYERNIKLKVEVEQLEKMVENFKNNLFQIMLKK